MKPKLNLIQALRGIAALLVVFLHTSSSSIYYYKYDWHYNIFRLGWCGVDFFFVLSGFIITYIHLADIKRRKNVQIFLLKRFVRIYPIFWIISLIYFVASVVMKQHTIGSIFSPYMIKSFLLIPTLNPLIGTSWSLCFEVAFYLVFAFCIVSGWRFAKWLAGLWFITILLFNILEVQNLPFLLNGYILEFLIGGYIGYLFADILSGGKVYTINHKLLLTGGSLIFIGGWIYLYPIAVNTSPWLQSRVIFGIGSALIILGSALADVKRSVKVSSFFLLLGDASYDIYLVHLLILAVFYKMVGHYLNPSGSWITLVLFGLLAASTAVAIGILIHIYLETKLIKGLNQFLLPKRKQPAVEAAVE